jgi:hypothetical protein
MSVFGNGALKMSSFVKSISLILSTVLLIACGSGSSGTNKPKPYSLDDYQGRAVSSESLAGTWVSVSTGQKILDGYSPYTQYTEVGYSNKQYFVITEMDEGYSKASCNGRSDSIVQSGDQISFNGMTGTNIDNQNFIFSENHEIVSNDVVYSEFKKIEMIKISDSVEKLGVVNLTDFPYGDDSLNINCFYQVNEVNLEGPDEAYSNEEYFVGVQDYSSSLLLKKYVGSFTRTLIYPLHYDSWGEFYQGSFNVSAETSFSHEISFSTVNEDPLDEYSFRYQGEINIQLPLQ